MGSPPRVRGKGAMPDGIAGHHRITPACAGKSQQLEKWHRAAEDHPRVCGEKFGTATTTDIKPGSPPRVRGKALMAGAHIYHYRITPACAGKSLGQVDATSAPADHPRVCGEKRTCPHQSFNKRWITPACAGKRGNRQQTDPDAQDHPRVCGEKLYGYIYYSEKRGSPPRVRGKVEE